MKRLLLLALPALLAGCQKPQPATDAAPPAAVATPAPAPAPALTPATTATPPAVSPTATAGAAASKTDFVQVAVIRAVAILPRYQWRLTDANDTKGLRIEALFARPERPITLDFSKGRLTVSNTCNSMGSTFALGGKQITVDKFAATKMACADPKLMALDAELAKRLQGKLGLRMTKGDAPPQLELKSAAGDVLVFASAALTGAGKDAQAVKPAKKAD